MLVKTLPSIRDDDALTVIADEIGAQAIDSYSLVPGLRLYQYDASISFADAQNVFMRSGLVEYAEPDYVVTTAAQNDPRFNELWAMENGGQAGGVVDADINATTMWAINSGDENIVIGVIDTGTDYRHVDLANNLWRNPLEVAGDGIDSDGNGYVDDVFGINAITNNGNPLDDNAHGTHVVGTIGGVGNNLVGVVGVMQRVKIASCKFLGSGGSGATSDAIECLQYFANLKTRATNPVNIVATNNSWGSTSRSAALEDAIRAHRDLGILFVAAAGNSTVNTDITPYYPANIELSNIISVAATDNADRLATFSNYGKRTVHVGAPGVRILSTVLNQAYGVFSGTSMAAPHVTGLAGIIKSRFPAHDYKKIKNLILSSGTPIAALQATTVTGRRIRGADANNRGALTCLNQVVTSRVKPLVNAVTIKLGESVFLAAQRINCDASAGPLVVYSDANQVVTLQDTGANGDAVASDGLASLLWQPNFAGTFSLNFGNGDIVTVTVTAAPPSYKIIPTTYSYEAISGTSVGATDESVHAVSAPFPIIFNNKQPGYQTLYVSSNGTISFEITANPGYTNRVLPYSAFTTLLAPYWDDFVPSGANSNIYYQTLGTSPNRRFVVEWRNMKNYNTTGAGTFQAVFFEGNSDVRYNYFDTDFSNASYNFGLSATVGVQSTATVATQHTFSTATVPSQSSLLFRLQ